MNYDNLIGKTFCKLTVLEVITPNKGRKKLKCKCDCGNITFLYPYQVVSSKNNVKSCGCLKHDTPYNATHKLSKERLYHVWETIRLRCNNPKNKKYYMYGARGIKVCDEWFNDFLTFREWAIKSGYKQGVGLSIDRINNNGNYEPSNCRWVDRKTQQRNTRRNRFITFNGKTQTLIDWCEELNLPYKTINSRLLSGWTIERAFNEPIHSK